MPMDAGAVVLGPAKLLNRNEQKGRKKTYQEIPSYTEVCPWESQSNRDLPWPALPELQWSMGMRQQGP